MEPYSAQESFFDDSGRHVTSQNDAGQGYARQDQYATQQDIEIYLDQHGRYVDASGNVLDGRTLGAILHGADVVLMYDPKTGGYQQLSQQNLRGGQFPGAGRQQAAPQKSWLQRLVSGELFQSDDKSQNQQHRYPQQGYSQYQYQDDPFPPGSGHAPYTWESAYGDDTGFYGGNFNGNYGGNYGQNTARQQPAKQQGFFATSQPSLIAQSRQPNPRNPNAMPGMVPNDRQHPMFHGMIPQEITLPDGVPAGEVIVYDESRGVNLFGNMQSVAGRNAPNASEQDQLAVLLQQMAMPTASPTMTNGMPTNNPQPGYVTPRVNLPMTEAETRMRQFQLRSAQQSEPPRHSTSNNANHQVAGRLENGVAKVSGDAFDAIGKLGRVTNLGDDTKRYALVGANGKAICLVTPTPGVALEPYLDQTVGITGIWGLYVREGDSFRQISAKAVYPIQGTRD